MLKKIEDMNYYELLEVSPRATSQEVHKAYERIRRIYEPNSIALYSLFSPEETEKIRQRIEEAYRTLIYDENRREYDLRLHGIEIAPSLQQKPQRRTAGALAAARKEEPDRQASLPLRAEPRPVPAAPPAPQVPTVVQPAPPEITEFTGGVLRMLREQRGLSLQNVADITKIGTRYLEWIENENFAKLPARPYLRGFLVNYTKALGYEQDRIANDYLKRVEAFLNPPKK